MSRNSSLDISERCAHKEHRCFWCGLFIIKGTQYVDLTFSDDDGDLFHQREHLECHSIGEKFLRNNNYDIFDFCPEMFHEIHDLIYDVVNFNAQNEKNEKRRLSSLSLCQQLREKLFEESNDDESDVLGATRE